MTANRSTTIVLFRDTPNSWRVAAEPDPADGTRCTERFETLQDARLFARQLRLARGWPITDRSEPAQSARQARRG